MLYAAAVLLLVGLDQLVKFLITTNLSLGSTVELLPGIIRLTYVRNTGAAFSMFSGMRWPLIAITIAVTVALILILVSKKITHPFGVWSLVFIIGGAIGNLIDRIWLGYVVDMFEPTFINFAVFNVADIFVVCGGIAFCIYFLKFYEDTPKVPKAGDSNED